MEVFKVVGEQWRILFGILLFIALGQGLVILTLKSLFPAKLTFIEYFAPESGRLDHTCLSPIHVLAAFGICIQRGT